MLGDKIRQYRKKNHLSQEELAEQLGVSRQSISLWENNQTQPTIENIVVLSNLFNISTDELLTTNSMAVEHSENFAPISMSPTAAPMPQTVTTPSTPPELKDENNEEGNQSVTPKSRKKVFLIGGIILTVLLIAGLFVAWVSSKNSEGNSPVLSAEEIYSQISPSVVEISAESATEISTGTGFFFDNKGTVVTNYHVIENCQTAKITLSNGSTYQVTAVLGYDADRDIAVLSTTCQTSKPLPLRSESAKTGEKVYALGSSLGLTGSLSDGIVSAVNREVEGNVYIQTTAPISQGNSGGPLVDEKGTVIGVVCASFTDGQNLNLAIPISDVHKIPLNKNITLEKLFPEPVQKVEWISDWRFSYYADEDTYVLLFQLADEQETPMSASGTVEIRIVNADNITVYNKTHKFTYANFEEWIYNNTDEMYLATIYISPQSIERGSTAQGTVYFEVYGNGYAFDECTEDVDCLPTVSNSTPNNTQQGDITPTNPQPGNNTPTNPQQGGTTQNSYTCMSSNCKNAVAKSGDYCSEHKCQNGDCGYERENNAKYCSICLCGTSGCLNAQIKNGYYCIDHTCSEAKCQYSKSANEKYCSYHACDICGELRLSTSLYCSQHQSSTGENNSQQGSTTSQPTQYTCTERTCNNIVSKSGEYCSTHKCVNSGCSYKKDTNSNYCSTCSCSKIGCKNGKIANGYYCTEHTCAASGCTSEKSYAKNYCFSHTCASCDNIRVDGGFYCVNHTCSVSGCTSIKGPSSDYCTSHQCMAGTCKKRRINGGSYCEEHTCIVEGCTNQKLTSDYCYSHTP